MKIVDRENLVQFAIDANVDESNIDNAIINDDDDPGEDHHDNDNVVEVCRAAAVAR